MLKKFSYIFASVATAAYALLWFRFEWSVPLVYVLMFGGVACALAAEMIAMVVLLRQKLSLTTSCLLVWCSVLLVAYGRSMLATG